MKQITFLTLFALVGCAAGGIGGGSGALGTAAADRKADGDDDRTGNDTDDTVVADRDDPAPRYPSCDGWVPDCSDPASLCCVEISESGEDHMICVSCAPTTCHDTENPAAKACSDDEDCYVPWNPDGGLRCLPPRGSECWPSSCVCTDDGWACTDDCANLCQLPADGTDDGSDR